MDNTNTLIQNLGNQTSAMIGNLNLQIANLMTENQMLKKQNQDLQTQVKMLKNSKSTDKPKK